MKLDYFQNKERGNVLNFTEMIIEFCQMYKDPNAKDPARWDEFYVYIGEHDFGD